MQKETRTLILSIILILSVALLSTISMAINNDESKWHNIKKQMTQMKDDIDHLEFEVSHLKNLYRDLNGEIQNCLINNSKPMEKENDKNKSAEGRAHR